MGNSTSIQDALAKQAEDKRSAVNDKLPSTSFYEKIAELKASLVGKVLLPDDAEYMEARARPWNQDQRGFPYMIVRVANSEDVGKAVKFVRAHAGETIFCVACGCHSSRSMVDDSIVIDLVNLNHSSLDLENKLVSVGGGSYLKVVDETLAPHNLGTTVGTYPLTGVGGLTLAGGYGWLARQYGMTVDNFVEAEVVLADGTVVVANDENDYRDLMWGLRGGGGNFGIVTRFTFRVHQLPPVCMGGDIVYLAPTIASAKEVVKKFDELYQELPNEIAVGLVFPAGAPVVPMTWAYFGSAKTPQEVPELVKASNLGGWITLANTIQPLSYHSGLQTILSPHQSSNFNYHSVSPLGNQNEHLSEEFIQTLLEFTRGSKASEISGAAVILLAIGGNVTTADVDNQKTAIPPPIRKAKYFVLVEAIWNPEQGQTGKNAARDWARKALSIVAKYRPGDMRYAPDEVNTGEKPIGDLAFKGEGIAGYTPELHARLGKLKTKYDPENLFRMNVNITPS